MTRARTQVTVVRAQYFTTEPAGELEEGWKMKGITGAMLRSTLAEAMIWWMKNQDVCAAS